MDPSLPALTLLLTLVLGFTHTTLALDQVDYCQGICPGFTRVPTHANYEEREYEASAWMCTVVENTSYYKVKAAHDRLDAYRKKKQSEAPGDLTGRQCFDTADPGQFPCWTEGNAILWVKQDVEFSENTWPGMVSVKQVGSEQEYQMCWLIPPTLTLSEEGSVTVETIPQTMFVRTFSGTLSIANGEQNAQDLKNDLEAAGESFDKSIYYGVGYESYFSFTHHNEIWYPKTS